MHKIFTTYHTLSIILIDGLLIFSIRKLFLFPLTQIFTKSNLIKLMLLALVTTSLSSIYNFQYDSGMNKVVVYGWPRGFYQIIITENGLAANSIQFRYFLEDFLLYFGASSLMFTVFKMFIKK